MRLKIKKKDTVAGASQETGAFQHVEPVGAHAMHDNDDPAARLTRNEPAMKLRTGVARKLNRFAGKIVRQFANLPLDWRDQKSAREPRGGDNNCKRSPNNDRGFSSHISD